MSDGLPDLILIVVDGTEPPTARRITVDELFGAGTSTPLTVAERAEAALARLEEDLYAGDWD